MLPRLTTASQAVSYHTFGTFCSYSRVTPTPRARLLGVSTCSGSIRKRARAPTSATAACMGVAISNTAKVLEVATDSTAYRRTLDFLLIGPPRIRDLHVEEFYVLELKEGTGT